EVAHVRLDVEGDAVHRYPAAHVQADRGDLAAVDPDAARARQALAAQAPVREHAERALFEPAYEVDHAAVPALEVDDAVGDELPRAVIGDVAAALCLHDLDAVVRQCRTLHPQVRL